ncbi:hypothetical protein GCM10020256_59710 [Streptomyces thermocoprophilus]
MRWIHAAGRGLLVLLVVLTGHVAAGARADVEPGSARGPLTLATAGDLTGYLGPPAGGLEPHASRGAGDARRAARLRRRDPRADGHRPARRARPVRRAQHRRRLDAGVRRGGWIRPLERGRFPLDSFLPPVVGTATYDGRLYAVPYVTNAGLLLYRKDVLDREGLPPPRTWAELERDARTVAPKYGLDGYAGQFLPYEGLTVNAAEAVYSAGGTILGDEGARVTVDSAAAREGIGFLVRGVREGGSRARR